MSVTSTGSANSTTSAQAVRRTPEVVPVAKKERPPTNEQNEAKAAAATQNEQKQASVNMQGQKVGQVINTQA
jgi:hypothetical protein